MCSISKFRTAKSSRCRSFVHSPTGSRRFTGSLSHRQAEKGKVDRFGAWSNTRSLCKRKLLNCLLQRRTTTTSTTKKEANRLKRSYLHRTVSAPSMVQQTLRIAHTNLDVVLIDIQCPLRRGSAFLSQIGPIPAYGYPSRGRSSRKHFVLLKSKRRRMLGTHSRSLGLTRSSMPPLQDALVPPPQSITTRQKEPIL